MANLMIFDLGKRIEQGYRISDSKKTRLLSQKKVYASA